MRDYSNRGYYTVRKGCTIQHGGNVYHGGARVEAGDPCVTANRSKLVLGRSDGLAPTPARESDEDDETGDDE